MISQPMAGLTDEKIARTRLEAGVLLESLGFEVVNTLHRKQAGDCQKRENCRRV